MDIKLFYMEEIERNREKRPIIKRLRESQVISPHDKAGEKLRREKGLFTQENWAGKMSSKIDNFSTATSAPTISEQINTWEPGKKISKWEDMSHANILCKVKANLELYLGGVMSAS